eukprot:GHVT01076818.1.p1 GENE.GHVT01076818.1~~GHVT01076818.1.p1  ORF type:complete len:107 (-),score=15.46 GHVT01076818.1:637-957(-)
MTHLPALRRVKPADETPSFELGMKDNITNGENCSLYLLLSSFSLRLDNMSIDLLLLPRLDLFLFPPFPPLVARGRAMCFPIGGGVEVVAATAIMSGAFKSRLDGRT